MKRAFDIAFSLTLIVLLSPVLAAVALFVRSALGSPVLFKQQRPGLGRQPFYIYKFRTMSDARGPDGELLSDEERLGKAGIWLRLLSLDELPQLFNVLKGDMSFVGPRPLLMKYLPYYSDRESKRFLMKPGITGLAQISGRNQLSWNERLELDAQYVERWSMMLDLRIICKTVLKVLKREDVSPVVAHHEPDLDHERSAYG